MRACWCTSVGERVVVVMAEVEMSGWCVSMSMSAAGMVTDRAHATAAVMQQLVACQGQCYRPAECVLKLSAVAAAATAVAAAAGML